MLSSKIKNLPIEQKLGLIEEIWETFRFNESEIESPSWHKKIIDERTALIKSGKANFFSLEDLREIVQ